MPQITVYHEPDRALAVVPPEELPRYAHAAVVIASHDLSPVRLGAVIGGSFGYKQILHGDATTRCSIGYREGSALAFNSVTDPGPAGCDARYWVVAPRPDGALLAIGQLAARARTAVARHTEGALRLYPLLGSLSLLNGPLTDADFPEATVAANLHCGPTDPAAQFGLVVPAGHAFQLLAHDTPVLFQIFCDPPAPPPLRALLRPATWTL